MNHPEHSLYRNFVTMFGDDGTLGGGFGQALRSNDNHIALNMADLKNIKKLRFLVKDLGKSL